MPLSQAVDAVEPPQAVPTGLLSWPSAVADVALHHC